MDDAKVKAYIAAGLSEQEAVEAVSWSAPLKRDVYQKAEAMFVIGLSINDINQVHTDFVRAELLSARGEFRWDDLRAAYNAHLYQEAVRLGDAARNEVSNAVSKILIILLQKWQKDFSKWASGETDSQPQFLPVSLDEIGKLTKILDDLTPSSNKSGDPALVSINIADSNTSISTSEDAAAELKRRLEQKRLGNSNGK